MNQKKMTKLNKFYVAGKYLQSLGQAMEMMLSKNASVNFYFNAKDDNKNRIELIDSLHEKAIEVLKLVIKDDVD